jgi:cell division protein FtsB
MRWLAGVLLLVLLGLQYRLWVGDGSLAEVRTLRDEIGAQMRELEQLHRRNQTLEAEVQDLREGMDALEERARSELGMIRQGEVFLQVIEESGDATPDEPASAAGEAPGKGPADTAPSRREGDGSAQPGAAGRAP